MAEADPKGKKNLRAAKAPEAFRTISEASEELSVPQHVLRFWETKFTQVRPLKRGGRRRYYRPQDLVLLRTIRELLYNDGYTIRGVQKLMREGAAARKEDPVLTEVDDSDLIERKYGKGSGSMRRLMALSDELVRIRELLKKV